MTRTIDERQRIAMQHDGIAKTTARRLANKFRYVEYDDALQDIRLRLFVATADLLSDDPNCVKNFMWRTALRAGILHGQRASKRGVRYSPRGSRPLSEVNDIDALASGDDVGLRSVDSLGEIEAIVNRLPVKFRDVFKRRHVEGRTLCETAELLGLPYTTAYLMAKRSLEIAKEHYRGMTT